MDLDCRNAPAALCEAFRAAIPPDAAPEGDRLTLVVVEETSTGMELRLDRTSGGESRQGEAVFFRVMDREIGPDLYPRIVSGVLRANVLMARE